MNGPKHRHTWAAKIWINKAKKIVLVPVLHLSCDYLKRHERCAIKHENNNDNNNKWINDVLSKHQMKKILNQLSIPTPHLTSPTY